MMGTLRSMLLLLLITTLSHNALGMPQADEAVKIITKPSPGEEYVLFQSGKVVIPEKHSKQLGDAVKGFSTSHKIPGQGRTDKSSLSSPLIKPENVFSTSHKITQYRAPLVKRSTDSEQKKGPTDENQELNRDTLLRLLSETILTPDQLLPQTDPKIKPQYEEIRTEYSVVTSKPRKVVPSAKYIPIVKIEPKGDSGVIEEKMNGPDVHKVMQRKLSVEQGKESRNISDAAEEESDESLIRSVQVKPVSQLGVTSPKFETKEGEISVPIQKMEVPYFDTVTTTTVLPLTSTTIGLTKSNFDIIPVNLVADKTKKEHEKDLDFVDSPLGDKLLVPSGSSSNQQSRIEVKKGPNGQDYEYEYVYYYYDDEDNDTIATADEKSHVSASPPTTISTTTEKTSTSGKRYLPSASHKDTDEEANHAAATRGRSRNRNQPQGVTEQQNHPEHLEGKPSNGRQRYATIERNRGEASTVAPESSNEVLPPSRGSRSRGRQLTLQTTPQPPDEPTPVAEERLPANTRFPPRSRSNHNSATVTTPSSEEALATRGRSSSGNGASSTTNGVRRPSLELVDSSSFRTHSSDASRGQDLTSQPPSFPSVLPSGPFRFLGVTPNEETVEKEVKHHSSRVRGRGDQGTATISAAAENADTETTSNRHAPHIRRPSTSSLPPELEEDEKLFDDEDIESIPTDELRGPVSHDRRPAPVTETPETDFTADNTVSTTEEDIGLTAAVMDKAALDLYAIFQQAQDENSSNFVDENATESRLEDDEAKENTTEGISTTVAVITTTSTTTTTTTTTEAPTTTTTTTEAPTTQATGSNRYKPRRIGHRGQNGQNKYRPNGASTSTTEPAPVETSTRAKGRFGNNRTPVGGGSFGRRGQHKTTSKPAEEEAVKEEGKEVVSTAPKNNGLPRTRFGTTRSTRVTSTTAATPDAGSTSSGTHAPRPAFADRYNTRRRGGPTRATSTPSSDVAKVDNISTEDNSEPLAVSEPSITTPRTAGRGRINIGGGPRPLRPGPKINIGGRPRPGAAPASAAITQAAPTESDQEGNEQASHPTTADDTQSEAQEQQETVTTPIPDALTRLRSRPRLHITGAVKTTAAPATNSNSRRHLVSSLLPKRRPLHPTPETKEPETDETHDSEDTDDSESAVKQSSGEDTQETGEGTATSATSATSETHDAPRENRLSSLLSGRRRANVARRPGTLHPSTGKQSAQDSA